MELTESEKRAILSLDIFRSVKKKDVLLEQGEKSSNGFFVLKGCLRTYYVVDGEERSTGFYTEMDVLTPHCLIDNNPSEYYIDCVEDSIVVVSNPEMEEKIFQEFPKFESLCRILSEQLLTKEQLDFNKFKISSPEQRYASLLAKRPYLLQRVPQHQLASYIGVKPQSLSRIRRRIAKN
ncbi:Crp/Fnr family transcriptional regulator [Flagellimonas sp.]|uniref:Crp/Fnr family transcriptional regulator n=1 Tax=Flagellimonas sp. TaxID=2058762 RepID=UPI003B51168B